MTRLRHLLPLLLAPLLATAEQRWSLLVSGWIEDLSENYRGYMYLVSNQSTPGDANNLVSFTVPAGSNRGVYGAAAPCAVRYVPRYRRCRTIFDPRDLPRDTAACQLNAAPIILPRPNLTAIPVRHTLTP